MGLMYFIKALSPPDDCLDFVVGSALVREVFTSSLSFSVVSTVELSGQCDGVCIFLELKKIFKQIKICSEFKGNMDELHSHF